MDLEKFVGRIRAHLFPHKFKRTRIEIRFITWEEANKLLREANGDWRLAYPEEDYNKTPNMVYLERVTNTNMEQQ